jgi:hypothetical protein
MKRILLILLLLGGGLCASAQVVTDIPVQGQAATKPAVRMVGGSGTGQGRQSVLEAVLTVVNPSGLAPGDPFDFELLITNRGKKPIVLPQSLNWGDVDTGGKEWRYISADVTLQVAPDGGHQRAWLDLGLSFYGSDERPGTELVLNPGDRARILGSGRLPLSMNINGSPIRKGTLAARFSVSKVWLHPAPTKDVPDGYRAESRTVAAAETEPQYPVEFKPE